MYEKYKNLDYNQRSHFLVSTNQESFELHSLAEKIEHVTIENFNLFYFAFYNVSSDSNQVGSQFRNYVAFILHSW